jgi:5-methylcytosine-specific restriction endonuclease McrA
VILAPTLPQLEQALAWAEQERAERLAKIRQKPSRDLKQKFYASAAWRRLRYRALADNAVRNGGVARCELCAAPAAQGEPLHADHIEPLSKNWDRRLDRTNIQIMCGPCNMGKSNKDTIDWRPTTLATELLK